MLLYSGYDGNTNGTSRITPQHDFGSNLYRLATVGDPTKPFESTMPMTPDDYIMAVMNVDDVSKVEINKRFELRKKFWNYRTDNLIVNAARVFGDKKALRTANFEQMLPELYNLGDLLYPESVFNTVMSFNSHAQWASMVAGNSNGTVTIFDTETIGDVQHLGQGSQGIFGATEIGFTVKGYKDGQIIGHSYKDILEAKGVAYNNAAGTYTENIGLGIVKNSSDYNYLIRARNKYATGGIPSLDHDEFIALKRASVYRDAYTELIQEGPYKGFYRLLGSQDESLTLSGIDAGISALTRTAEQYEGRDRGQMVFDLLNTAGVISVDPTDKQRLIIGTQGNNVVAGAHVSYDLKMLAKEMMSSSNATIRGYGTQLLGDDAVTHFADILAFEKALASSIGVDGHMGLSLNQFYERYGAHASTGGSVEASLYGLGFNRKQLHVGSSDTFNEFDVGDALVRKSLEFGDVVINRMGGSGEGNRLAQRKVTNLSDKAFFFHHGKLNLIDGIDFAKIGGQSAEDVTYVPSMSIAGQVWGIDEARTGYMDLTQKVFNRETGEVYDQTKRMFVTTLYDYADGNERNPGRRSEVVLTANSPEEMGELFRRNATMINGDRNSPLYKQIVDQRAAHRRDIARREWDKMFTVNGVENLNGRSQGGFFALKQFLEDADKIGRKTRPENIFKAAGEAGIDMTIYDAMAYPDLFKRINTENLLVTNVVKNIESTYGIPENLAKMPDYNMGLTLALQRGYSAGMGVVERLFEGRNPDAQLMNATLSGEVAGIDLVLDSNGLGTDIVRINATSKDALASSLSNVFRKHFTTENGGINRQGINDVMFNLRQRGLINADTHESFNARLWFGSDFNPDNFYNEVGEIAGDLYQNRYLPESSSYHHDEATRVKSYFARTYNGLNIDEIIKENHLEGQIDEAVRKEVQRMYALGIGLSTNGDKLINEQNIKRMAAFMGYGDPKSQDIIAEMFTNGKYGMLNQEGYASFLFSDEINQSMFAAIMPSKNASKFINAIANNDLDTRSYKAMTANGRVFNYAGVIEIPHVDTFDIFGGNAPKWMSDPEKNPLGIGTIKMAKVSDTHSLFLNPTLSTWNDHGKLKARLDSGMTESVTFYRRAFEDASYYLYQGDYETFSRMMRKTLSRDFDDLSSSSTYVSNDLFSATAKRYMDWTAADFIQAGRIKIKGIKDIFIEAVTKSNDENLSNAMKIIRFSLGEELKGAPSAYEINNMAGFDDFFHTHLFLPINTEKRVADAIKDTRLASNISNINELGNKNMFELIHDAILNPKESGEIDDSLKKVVTDLFTTIKSAHDSIIGEKDPNLYSVVDMISGVRANQQDIISIGMSASTFNSNAASGNTVRPLYQNAMRGLRINRNILNSNYGDGVDNGYLFVNPIIDMNERRATNSIANEYDVKASVMRSIDGDIADVMSARAKRLRDTDVSFAAVVKNMDNLSLQRRYAEMSTSAGYEEFLRKYGDKIDINLVSTYDKYKNYLQSFRGFYDSNAEDASFMRPSVGEMLEDALPRDAKKYTMPLGSVDISRTRQYMLDKLNDQGVGIISNGDVIGYKLNGDVAKYSGTGVFEYTRENVMELFPEGLTQDNIKAYPEAGRTNLMFARGHSDISGRKIIIGDWEKSMTQYAKADKFQNIIGAKDRQTALSLLDSMFSYTFGDDVAFVTSMGLIKHASSLGTTSLMSVAAKHYAQAGKLEQFSKLLMSDAFAKARMNMYGGENGIEFAFDAATRQLGSSTEWAKNYNAFVEQLYDMLKNGTNETMYGLGDVDINRAIINEIEGSIGENKAFLPIAIANVNEITGTAMRVDNRMEQAAWLGFGGGDAAKIKKSSEIGQAYREYMREYAEQYNGRVGGVSDDGKFKTYATKFFDAFSQERNVNAARMRASGTKTEALATGYLEAFDVYSKSGYYGKHKDQYVHISIDDIVNGNSNAPYIPSGANNNPLDMQRSPFFVDDEASEYLVQQVSKQGGLIEQKKGLAIDLGTTIKLENGVELDSVVVPLHDITEVSDTGEYYTQGSAGLSSRFIRRVASIKANIQGKYSEPRAQEAAIAEAYKDLMDKMAANLSPRDKKGEMYKMFNTYTHPTSTELMGVSMASGLPESLANNAQFNADHELIKKLYANIAENNGIDQLTTADILGYAEALTRMGAAADETASKIEKGQFDMLANVPENIAKHIKHIDEHGQSHYGYVMSASADALTAIGLDFNQLSADVIEAYEYNNAINLEGFNTLDQRFIKEGRDRVIDKLNEINSGRELYKELQQHRLADGTVEEVMVSVTEFSKDRALMGKEGQFSKYARALGLDSEGKFSGKHLQRTVNESIAEGGSPVEAMYKAFGASSSGNVGDSLGGYFMKTIGSYVDLKRFPIFKNQPVARLLLDESISGKSAKFWSALFHFETNLDFDGDKEFLAAFLDGGSVMKTNSRAFAVSKAVYEDFVTNYSNMGTAEAIRDMDFINYDMIMGRRMQNAARLKMYDVDAYKEAIHAYKVSHASTISAILGDANISSNASDKIINMLASASNEMNERYSNAVMNGAHGTIMVLQSIRTKRRNAEIGSISTPAYKTRNALITVENALNGLDASAERSALETMYYDVKGGMFNMFSKKGGLMALAEQDVISAKSSENLLELVPIVLYSKGMSRLTHAVDKISGYGKGIFNPDNRKLQTQIALGIDEIITGQGSNIYKFLTESNGKTRRNALAALGGQYSYSKLSQIEKELRALKPGESLNYDISSIDAFTNTLGNLNGKNSRFVTLTSDDAGYVRDVRMYRGLAELFGNEKLRPAITMSEMFGKEADADAIVNYLKELTNVGEKEAKQLAEGSMISEMLEAMMNSKHFLADDKLPFADAFLKKDNVYFIPGQVQGKVNQDYLSEAQIVMYSGLERGSDGKTVPTFREVTYKDGRYALGGTVDALSGVEQIITDSDQFLAQHELAYGDFLRMSQQDISAYTDKSAFMTRKNLASSLIDADNGTIRSDIAEFRQRTASNSPEIADIFNIYESANAERLRIARDTRSLLIRNNALNSTAINESTPALIRRLNEQIAQNPNAYKGQRFNDILTDEIFRSIQGANPQQIYAEATSAASHLPANAIDTVNSAIENINNNRYNSSMVRSELEKDVASNLSQIENLRHNSAYSLDAIDNAANVIGGMPQRIDMLANAIDKNYADAVSSAEGAIRTALGGLSEVDRNNAFNAMFNLNAYSIDNARVGFGRFMGLKFDELRSADIDEILNTVVPQGANEVDAYAVKRTQEMLETYMNSGRPRPTAGSYLDSRIMDSAEKNAIKSEMSEAVTKAYASANDPGAILDSVKEQMNEAAEAASQQQKQMFKKTLGEVKDKIFNNENVLKYGMAAAALGIAMKALHRKDGGSPLMPKEKHKQDEPGYDNTNMQYGKITDDNIYVDRNTGLKFDVSARTASRMQALNAQQFEGMYGNKVHNINITQDTSTINNNWLANRFAELSE